MLHEQRWRDIPSLLRTPVSSVPSFHTVFFVFTSHALCFFVSVLLLLHPAGFPDHVHRLKYSFNNVLVSS